MRTRETERAVSRGKGVDCRGRVRRVGWEEEEERVKRGGDSRGRKTNLSGRPSVRVRESESESAPARAAERVQQWQRCVDARLPDPRPVGRGGRGQRQRVRAICPPAFEVRGTWRPVSASASAPVPFLGRMANGRRLAAGATGPASSEGPGGLFWWPGEGRAARSAGGTGPAFLGQESQDTPSHLTY